MQWALPYHPAVYLFAASAVFVLLYFARRMAVADSLRSLWFFAPRLLVLGLVFLVLLNPVRESARQLPPTRAQISCLIDGSRSMGLDRPLTRMAAAKEFVVDSQTELDRKNGAELQLYSFGSRLTSVPSLSDLSAEDDESDLGGALSTLEGIFPEPPKAILVISDGQIGDTESLLATAKNYHARGIPVHVCPLGSPDIQGDIAIERLSVPRKVKARDQVPIRVAVRSQGFDGQRVQLRVTPRSNSGAAPLAELPITLRGGSQSHDIVVPADPNAGELVIGVPLQHDEAIESNNQVPFELLARERKVRVFYMEGTEGSEYRYIRDALQDDPNIKCVSAVVDNQYASRPRLSRVDDSYRGFPATREELFEYDVVICSDISQGAFTREQLEWTAELVRERGGGFVMIGGYTSFGAGMWDQTVWDQLIPIDMRGGSVGRGLVNQTFRATVPAKVRTHPIWRISEDSRLNDRIIDSMPPFHGTNIAKRVKPAAELLAESAGRLTVAGKSPVFACQSYGRGRTFAMLPDSTVSWGSDFERHWGENDNRYFRKFWRNVVNWLSENSVSSQRRLVVDTDKLIYRPGESILLSVQAYDDQFKATTRYRVSVSCAGMPDQRSVSNALVPSGGKYTGKIGAFLPRTEAGDEASTLVKLNLELRATDGSQEVATQKVTLQVLNDSDELLTPQANPEPLRALADATGGKLIESPAELIELLAGFESVPSKRVVYRTPVWDKPWLWLGILGLIVSEWMMRRRSFG